MVEASGDTVEEAVAKALAELAIPREAAEIEVLSEGTKAVPGERISAGLAKVRVRPVDAYAGRAKGLLEELLTLMEIPARVSVRRAVAVRESEAGREPVILDISGDDLGMLIGWRGENRRAAPDPRRGALPRPPGGARPRARPAHRPPGEAHRAALHPRPHAGLRAPGHPHHPGG
jgi:hypothetical protein